MRDVIKSIKTHCENTGKASYELVKTSRQIVDIIQSNNQLMKEQGVIDPSQTGGPPSGGISGPGGISPPAPGYLPFAVMPAVAPIRAKFWQYQPVVAPSMEPNESRNPPSAAYAAQECPAKNPGGLEVLDESGNQRTVSPTLDPKSRSKLSMQHTFLRAGCNCQVARCTGFTLEVEEHW